MSGITNINLLEMNVHYTKLFRYFTLRIYNRSIPEKTPGGYVDPGAGVGTISGEYVNPGAGVGTIPGTHVGNIPGEYVDPGTHVGYIPSQ